MADLILVPTQIELDPIREMLEHDVVDQPYAFQLCGFGPIASAARTAALIARYHPDRVLLIGIAGTFDPVLHPVGTSCRFDEVVCDGVGVGVGDNFISAGEMGWNHFGSEYQRPRISDLLPLVSTFVNDVPCAGQLLTSPAASASHDDADRRRRRYPKAIAEDMEGFGVATACALAGVSLQIVRGISNIVGDRVHANWRIDDALTAAASMAACLIRRPWIPSIA
ncbi:Futalosine hydrolase [Rubripirellula tenax]|uniref:Futalosine hydrolase n=1 Tax=Rubripirellula tenax TaxID=2528015 RepID=A0A5C6FJG9_9BACT|nr:futalosine hydrolase [Rubripirellula tenax]TWU59864.1 Futalosine hydrolase [Rubripirellula tenax]